MTDELSELVNDPVERMDVEYKSWIDLSIPKTRADMARHIAAIANYGGGSIVFGVSDDGASCGSAPDSFQINHDIIGAITKKYLEPSIHCDVRWTLSSAGIKHPVIQVPTHGATPICAKANGPEIKGRTEGIVAGVHYLRKPGPESSPIISASEWRDLIRRCALHERAAILTAISAALSHRVEPAGPSHKGALEAWAQAADRKYEERLKGKVFHAPLHECRLQLSYRIETQEYEKLPSNGFTDMLRRVANEVDQYVQSGWSLFYVFNAEEIAPSWSSDPVIDGIEFVEADLIREDSTIGFDLWRISPEGLATVIREHWEDTKDFGIEPRTALDPRILTKTVGELIRHAELFGRRFNEPLRVEFLCHWQGLAGRQLRVQNGMPIRARKAKTDFVVTSGMWPYSDLIEKTPQIVEALTGKVARALDWEDFDAGWVEQQMPTWPRG